MKHFIKLNERFANEVYDRRKTFEVRKNDRVYQKGDTVQFTLVNDDGQKVNPLHPINGQEYEITFVLSGWGIEQGYVVFSITPV